MANVLVVDDVSFVRQVIRGLLQQQGHAVVEADDGASCLKALGEGAFDLVILDMIMPGVDGIETVKRIRMANPGIRILAISGGADAFPAGIALKMSEMYGADRILVKPFADQELLVALDGLLPQA